MNKQDLIKHLRNQSFPDNIIKAFENVDRSKFIPELKSQSYEDVALPIGFGQTISQPYTIAFMLMLLNIKDGQRILEVGSGSGYVLELLSNLNPNGEIIGAEIVKELAEKSRPLLKNKKNIEIISGNGLKEIKKLEEFDRIIVSAASTNIPQKLLQKLKFSGVLVAPVKNSIIIIEKNYGENKVREYHGFSFVPLIE